MQGLDDMDMSLLYELNADGSASVPTLSKKLGIRSSVLYSRIQRLVKRGIIKRFTIDIDHSLLGMRVKASVGANRDPKLAADIRSSLLDTPEVFSV